MAPSCTVKYFLTIHKPTRTLYEMFVTRGMEDDTACKVVALLILLNQFGIDIATSVMNIINDGTRISKIIAETKEVLCCLQQNDGQHSYSEIPLITSMAENKIDINFFNFHKDFTVRRLTIIIDEIGSYVFNDQLYELLRLYESKGSAEVPISNALAKLYDPAVTTMLLPEQERSMLITFYWERIESDEIVKYFTQKWGNCVDRVDIPPGRTPIFGLIVFRSQTYLNLVFKDGNQELIYNINGKKLKARRFAAEMIYEEPEQHNLPKKI